jgi:lysophospholipase L1-like esterase
MMQINLTNRRRFLLFGLLGVLNAASAAHAQQETTPANQEPATGNQAAPPPISPVLKEITDVPGLPRILLIGDSISMGYTLPVRTKLEGRANVHRPTENCGETKRGIEKLDKWLGEGHWDIIHFNFGLHDMKYLDEQNKYVSPDKGKQVATPDVYAENLRKIVARLKQTGAKLIFATTTPVPIGTVGRVEKDDLVYNKVALQVMKETNVDVDDLGGYVQRLQSKLPPLPPPQKGIKPSQRSGDIQLPYNVHFTKDGYRQLADLVTASIIKLLPAAKK